MTLATFALLPLAVALLMIVVGWALDSSRMPGRRRPQEELPGWPDAREASSVSFPRLHASTPKGGGEMGIARDRRPALALPGRRLR
jgi:hypothetical protein